MLTILLPLLKRWILPFLLLFMFILPLAILNWQFLRAAGEVDNLLDGYTLIAVQWAQAENLFFSSEEEADRTALYAALDDIRDWLASPELERLGEFTGLDQSSELLFEEMDLIENEYERSIGDFEKNLFSVSVTVRNFRNKLDNGISILFLSQLLLIVLLMILIIIALEDRTRQKFEIETAHRIQVEISRAQEEERNRIALDLHDDIAQELSWMRMGLHGLNPGREKLEIVDNLISRIRDLSQSLRTPDFTTEFFDDAVRDLIRTAEQRSDLVIKFLPGEKRPDEQPEVYGHVYRIIQECLNNAVKYSGSCRAFIELQEEDDSVYYEYRDNGSGFNPDSSIREKSLGLKGIRNRILMMNGEMILNSKPGHGISLKCRIPLKGMKND